MLTTALVLRGQVIFHLGERAISAGGGDFVVEFLETLRSGESRPGALYLLTVLSRDEGFADLLQHGIPTPLDAEDLAVLRTNQATPIRPPVAGRFSCPAAAPCPPALQQRQILIGIEIFSSRRAALPLI